MSGFVKEAVAVYGRRKMTVDEYYRAAETGVFKPDEKLELIHGEVYRKVSPAKSRHAATVSIVDRELEKVFGEGFHSRPQLQIRLDSFNEPEPDIAIVKGAPEDYWERHPGPSDIVLLVEVSDSTLGFDRGLKARLYAEFGIEDYWVVNLRDRRLEVFRQPANEGYRISEIYDMGSKIVPLYAPELPVAVSRLILR